mgnify:CR=1 FL=1
MAKAASLRENNLYHHELSSDQAQLHNIESEQGLLSYDQTSSLKKTNELESKLNQANKYNSYMM